MNLVYMPLRPTEPRTVVRTFDAVWLWRDDLAEIVSVMRQAEPDLVLQADTYMLDDVSELIGINERCLDSFRAASADGRIRLTLGAKEASISADDPDLRTRGMLEEVYRVATHHKRPLFRSRVFVVIAMCSFVLFFLAATWVGRAALVDRALAITLLAAGVVGICAGTWGLMFDRPHRQAVIHAQTRAEAPLWLARNRDSLITNAIVSAVFLVVGIVIGKLLN